MMRSLESGQGKIQKICDKLRLDTLEPAKAEAALIIEEAKARADKIIEESKNQSVEFIKEAHKRMEQERSVFEASLAQAAKQSREALRQSIEKDLFNDQMAATLEKQAADPKVIAKILDALVASISQEGISADFSAVLPQTVSQEEVAKHLAEGVYEKLRKNPFVLGDFSGGVRLKLVDKKMTLDISDAALKSLLSKYVRKEFHALLFGEG